jgi:hypothetical protein
MEHDTEGTRGKKKDDHISSSAWRRETLTFLKLLLLQIEGFLYLPMGTLNLPYLFTL